VAEGGGLLNRYTVEKPYRGFESLSLLHLKNLKPIGLGIFYLRRARFLNQARGAKILRRNPLSRVHKKATMAFLDLPKARPSAKRRARAEARSKSLSLLH
jgi:hypothetical protein